MLRPAAEGRASRSEEPTKWLRSTTQCGDRQQYGSVVKRADNVVAYFESQGVNANIISAKGFGDTHPVASNDTPQGNTQNRRIEIVMQGPGA
jgi:hypothetical protein